MEFEHEIVIAEYQLQGKLPRQITGLIGKFTSQQAQTDMNDVSAVKRLHAYSASIADQIITFYEETNQYPENTMLENEELKRAQAVGLDANATIDDVIAKEKEIADAEAKAKADKEAADAQAKAQADQDAADAEAKAKADKEGADTEAKAKADKDAADAEAQKKADTDSKAKQKADWEDTPLGAIGLDM
jgi:membrane protein involved in colicin uptake